MKHPRISTIIVTFAFTMATKRIEYIDAMRGFTMILVVYSHICHFCLGDSTMGFNVIFFLFRLPCFFFVSGWLFEPAIRHPFLQTARKKFMVQIVPTFIFLLLLAPPPEFFHQLGTLKGGYWFTFVLFEFFLICMLADRLCRRWNWLAALVISIATFSFAACKNHLGMVASQGSIQSLMLDISGLLSVPLWRYYLFFFIGTLVRRHFDMFVKLTDKPLAIFGITVGFFAIAFTAHPANPILEYLRFNVGGILGMFMVFTFFRLSASWLLRSFLSRPLLYVGTRTLDIYLLHFFFLPRFLLPYGGQLLAYNNPLLEFGVAMMLALVVLILSLAVSYVIRLSPFLAHYLFGVKNK